MTNIMRIMDGKVIGIDIAGKLGLRLPQQELEKYNKVPFSEGELKDAYTKGFFLVAMPSVSLLNLPGVKLRWEDWRHEETLLLGNKSRAGYHLLGELKNSERKGWKEQHAMLPVNYDTPYTVEMTYLALAWSILKRRPAFENWVRCADVSEKNGWHILVRANPEMSATLDFVDSDYPDNRTSIATGRYRPVY